MTGEQFTDFLERMGWTDLEAADKLEIGRDTVARYRKAGAPRTVDYACAAIEFGLPPLSDGRPDRFAVPRRTLEQLQDLTSRIVQDMKA